jgi:hypothetical protein
MIESISMYTEDSLLLQLPHELIYKIAAVDAIVYNAILRLCRTVTLLFPLSTRLDFMIDFGVTVCVISLDSIEVISWSWHGLSHDIFGPSRSYAKGNRSYWYRGGYHRVALPAIVWKHSVEWYDHDLHHRDLTAPAGTGIEWLRGAADIYEYNNISVVTWYQHGKQVKKIKIKDNKDKRAAEVRAEIAYWQE